jgi:hypothetical protein
LTKCFTRSPCTTTSQQIAFSLRLLYFTDWIAVSGYIFRWTLSHTVNLYGFAFGPDYASATRGHGASIGQVRMQEKISLLRIISDRSLPRW